MVSSSSEGIASKMSIVRRRSVTRMLAVSSWASDRGRASMVQEQQRNQSPGSTGHCENVSDTAFGENGRDEIVDRRVVVRQDRRLGVVEPLVHQLAGHDVGHHTAILALTMDAREAVRRHRCVSRGDDVRAWRRAFPWLTIRKHLDRWPYPQH